METTNTYKAIVKTNGSKTLAKSNGGTYVLQNVEIQEGPAKGVIVLASRTTLTKDGVIKSVPEIGTEIVVYHTIVPSTKEGEKNQHFFEIGSANDTADNTTLDAIFGL